MFSKEVYIKRRNRLRELVGDGLILILGNNEAPMDYPDNTYLFHQDCNFVYFFGLDHAGFAGVLDVDANEDTLYGNDVDIDDIIWMGPQPSVQELASNVGVSKSSQFSQLEKVVKEALAKGRKVHFLPPYRHDNIILLETLTGINPSMIQSYASIELVKAVIELRSVKDEHEIKELDMVCNTGYKMHVAAMQACKPGVLEQEIVGILEGISVSGGGLPSFPIILSQNGETLHNHYHGNILEKGKLMLTDAGATAASYYCSDATRTVPVGGKFTSKQKDIYNAVLAANNKGRELTKPGITYKEVHLAACKELTSHLQAAGLMKGNLEDSVAAGAHALFMPHGLGHMMGLNTHDMEDLGQNYVGFDDEVRPSSQFGLASLRMGRRLQEGFVITNEPGCYFIPALIDKWRAENINTDFINFDKLEEYKTFGGIRLEDDILVTKDSCRILGDRRIPITVEEVEDIMK
ncbi:MAG: aminopeptidase P family protein [Marinifilaceae bacterium]|jgi:Xaa-Pro aminopeptidase|nr:aminopeptidase P family protein [Marinilabiliaceae bacterium JC040]MCT4599962.1 aminopeptidase P family protein [Marinifilaceae bacterium]